MYCKKRKRSRFNITAMIKEIIPGKNMSNSSSLLYCFTSVMASTKSKINTGKKHHPAAATVPQNERITLLGAKASNVNAKDQIAKDILSQKNTLPTLDLLFNL